MNHGSQCNIMVKYMGSHPGSVIHLLCDLGQVTKPL